MITFFAGIAFLLTGYFVYGRICEKIFGVDKNRSVPALQMADGIDYVPLGWRKIFLIQFLNIAGLGPIFGAIAGAMWGPVAFLWIALGCVFAGAFHDFFSGMLSLRHNGLSIPEITGRYLGKGTMQFMRVFTVFLMILVGAVFVIGPAGIIQGLTPDSLDIGFWSTMIFIYYILATLLPVDKLIGRVYPVFGFALLFMAAGIIIALLAEGYSIPELNADTFRNMHSNAEAFSVFPMLFVTIACGAISGFHATQSPMMARCIQNESYGRRVFYGAMIAEGIVAMIWAAAAMAFFGGVPELNTALGVKGQDPAWAVNLISNSLLGKLGGILAILGVVAAPITSGDTAFRSARLIIADFFKLSQKSIRNRLYIVIPIFIAGFILTKIDFFIIWRYMAWSNQSLACIVLWTITSFLIRENKFYFAGLLPAVFMTAVCSTYILAAPEGFSLPYEISLISGLSLTLVISAVAIIYIFRQKKRVLYQA